MIKRIKRIVLIFVWGLGFCDCFGQIAYQKTYSGTNHTELKKIILTSDGGYAFMGSILNQGMGMNDLLIVKVDSAGNLEWSKSYGGLNEDYGISMVENPGGGYFLLGNSYTFSAGNLTDDIIIINIDANGNILWSKLYGGTGNDEGKDMLALHPGINNTIEGIIVAGLTTSFGSSQQSALAFKIDTLGNLLWANCYSQNSSQYFNKVIELSSGLVFGGATTQPTSSTYDAYFVNTNSSGLLLWSKRIGGNGNEKIYDCVKNNMNNFIAYGTSTAGAAGGLDVMIIMMQDSGNYYSPVLRYGSPEDDLVYNVSYDTVAFGNYFVTGYTTLQTGASSKNGFFVFAHDNSGNLTYPGLIYGDTSSQNKCFSALIRKPWSNNFAELALAGFTNGFGQTNGSAYFIKTHHSLNTCNEYPLSFQYNYFTPQDSMGSDTLSISLSPQNITLAVANLALSENTVCFVTGINENTALYKYNDFNIFPNPTTGSIQLTLSTKHNAPLECEIINIMGERVYEAPLPASPRGGEGSYAVLNVSFLAKGIYVVRVGDGERWENKKLVVE